MSTQQEAIKLIENLNNQLIEITKETTSTRDTTTGYEKLKRWKERASKNISSKINQIEGDKLSKKRKGSFRMGDPLGNFTDEAKMYIGFLDALKDELTNYPDDVLERAVPAQVTELKVLESNTIENNCVFIVHGHDELNLLRTKELLRERWALESVVLAGKPGKGRTIVEKFEEEAQRASFAFVLLTPDDVIQKNDEEYSQARPNVIFELGWFYGRLGREKVCILFKEGTKIHSDLDGVSRIQFKDSVTEVTTEIEAELIEAGLLTK